MINPITCVCVLMAAGSGLYLFQEKQQVQMLDRQIEQVLHAADAAHARTGMLRAEYALLNDPSRLQELSRQHLPTLVNTAPTQFASLVDLDRRLPAVGSAAPAEPAPVQPTVSLAQLPQAAPPAAAAEVPVAPVPAAPVQVAVAPATPRPTPFRAASRTAQAHLAAAVAIAPLLPAVVAAAPPPATAHAARAALRTTTQRFASRQPANQRLILATRGDPYPTQPATTVEAVQRVARGAPVDAGSPMVGSSLGMARSMLALSPVASASTAAFYNGGAQSR